MGLSIRSRPSRPRIRMAARALAAVGLLLLAGCGKKGPPLAPLKRGPDRVTEVAARQIGKEVLLTGNLPDRSQDESPLKPILELRVFRLVGSLGIAPGFGSMSSSLRRAALRQFTKESKRIATLSGEALGKVLQGRRFTFRDSDTGLETNRGRDLMYAVTVVDAENRSSPLSSLVSLRLTPALLPPSNLQAEVSEKRIRLHWEPPSPPAGAGSQGYNVYRSEEEGKIPERPRNDRPLPQPFFEDEQFAFGRTYRYVVRSVAGEKPPYPESEDSVPVSVTPVDVYPPAAPTGVAVSAEAGVMKLYWFPNGEADLGGYRIYRSEKESGQFERIAEVGPRETTYVDSTVQPGIRYSYYITAQDLSSPPNESERSEVRSDRLPPSQKTGGSPGTPKR